MYHFVLAQKWPADQKMDGDSGIEPVDLPLQAIVLSLGYETMTGLFAHGLKVRLGFFFFFFCGWIVRGRIVLSPCSAVGT